jgi:hypothetical protein
LIAKPYLLERCAGMDFIEYPIGVGANVSARRGVGVLRCFRSPSFSDILEAIWDSDIGIVQDPPSKIRSVNEYACVNEALSATDEMAIPERNRPEKTAREAISPAVPAGSMAPSPPSAESQIRPLLQYACALNYNARALGKYRCWIGISMLLEIA